MGWYAHYGGNHTNIFSDIYRERIWCVDGDGGPSGAGSSRKYNDRFSSVLRAFISKNKVGTVTDVGCGDLQYIRMALPNEVDYLGLDVVPAAINAARLMFEPNFPGQRMSFGLCDASKPKEIRAWALQNELVLLKDVLQHWPDDDIRAALNVLTDWKNNQIKFIVLVNGKWNPKDRREERVLHPIYHSCNLHHDHGVLKEFACSFQGSYQRKHVLLIARPHTPVAHMKTGVDGLDVREFTSDAGDP